MIRPVLAYIRALVGTARQGRHFRVYLQPLVGSQVSHQTPLCPERCGYFEHYLATDRQHQTLSRLSVYSRVVVHMAKMHESLNERISRGDMRWTPHFKPLGAN